MKLRVAEREAELHRLVFRPVSVRTSFAVVDAVNGEAVEGVQVIFPSKLTYNHETGTVYLPPPEETPDLSSAGLVTIAAEGYESRSLRPVQLGRYDPTGARKKITLRRTAGNIVILIPASTGMAEALGPEKYQLLRAFLEGFVSTLKAQMAVQGFDSVETFFATDTALTSCDISDIRIPFLSGITTDVLLRGSEDPNGGWSPYSDQNFGSRIGEHTAIVVLLGNFVLPHSRAGYDRETSSIKWLHIAHLSPGTGGSRDEIRRDYCTKNSDSCTVHEQIGNEDVIRSEGQKAAALLLKNIPKR